MQICIVLSDLSTYMQTGVESAFWFPFVFYLIVVLLEIIKNWNNVLLEYGITPLLILNEYEEIRKQLTQLDE